MRQLIVFFSMIMLIFSCNSAKNQVTKVAEIDSITKMILDTNFVFHARNANPMAGGNVILNYNYTLTVKSDSIIGWLPYFGRSFSAPLNPSDGGVKFTTTRYKYDIQPNKKKSMYQIHIVPKDLGMFATVNDVQQIWMNVGTSGYATVQIVSNTRTPISYTGTIEKK
ncbi:DUF4251 domain-containing protein [Rhizosphaericola mali]|uniref:DUF4251 domain-containing protein n=1 Tax=Rhizosphaericola mali TaxID=2545455 RepID=A0A5P2G5Y8_9BACT|nr:DUF4251 domain-containing protein [Rhizosphaericola mali]QES90068.1 DUF4251 domain-containing protein [Rhizosphaericola mali]